MCASRNAWFNLYFRSLQCDQLMKGRVEKIITVYSVFTLDAHAYKYSLLNGSKAHLNKHSVLTGSVISGNYASKI